MAIDTSCIWWKRVCGKKFSCGYYDNDVLRNRLAAHKNTVTGDFRNEGGGGIRVTPLEWVFESILQLEDVFG